MSALKEIQQWKEGYYKGGVEELTYLIKMCERGENATYIKNFMIQRKEQLLDHIVELKKEIENEKS